MITFSVVVVTLWVIMLILKVVGIVRESETCVGVGNCLETFLAGVAVGVFVLIAVGKAMLVNPNNIPEKLVYVNRCTNVNNVEHCGAYEFEDEKIHFIQDSTGRFDLKIK